MGVRFDGGGQVDLGEDYTSEDRAHRIGVAGHHHLPDGGHLASGVCVWD
jgi:hypothetical protein